jgi:hypothetical protein
MHVQPTPHLFLALFTAKIDRNGVSVAWHEYRRFEKRAHLNREIWGVERLLVPCECPVAVLVGMHRG